MNDEELVSFLIREAKAGRLRYSGRDQTVFKCPACDRDDHLYLCYEKNLYHCFLCEFSGTLIRSRRGNPHRWAELGRVTGMVEGTRDDRSLPSVKFGGPRDRVGHIGGSEKFVRLRQKCGDGISINRTHKYISYCLGRGMTIEQLEDYQVSSILWDPRVYFPYWDEAGHITYWMGRAIHASIIPKTLEPEGADKPLFGDHLHNYGSRCVLVEGVFDHLATPRSYALMGSSLTKGQLWTLRKLGIRQVLVILDPQEREKSKRVAAALLRVSIWAAPVFICGTDKDPAELGRSVMKEVVHIASKILKGKPRIVKVYPEKEKVGVK